MDLQVNQVLSLYNDLQFGQTREIKNSANEQILIFMVSKFSSYICLEIRCRMGHRKLDIARALHAKPAVHRRSSNLQKARRPMG